MKGRVFIVEMREICQRHLEEFKAENSLYTCHSHKAIFLFKIMRDHIYANSSLLLGLSQQHPGKPAVSTSGSLGAVEGASGASPRVSLAAFSLGCAVD